jgi:hypothetical protein
MTFLNTNYPAPSGAVDALQNYTQSKPEKFERLPMNLSPDEIREMVLEVLG